MGKSENTKSRRTAVRAGCAIALTGVCAGLVPGAVQAEEKKLLIGIVELQLTNPFFDSLKKSAIDTAKKNGLDVMTAEANTAGDSATQITAIENMINRGVKGITLDPANATRACADREESARCGHRRRDDEHFARPDDRGRRRLRDRQPAGGRPHWPIGQGDHGPESRAYRDARL